MQVVAKTTTYEEYAKEYIQYRSIITLYLLSLNLGCMSFKCIGGLNFNKKAVNLFQQEC